MEVNRMWKVVDDAARRVGFEGLVFKEGHKALMVYPEDVLGMLEYVYRSGYSAGVDDGRKFPAP